MNSVLCIDQKLRIAARAALIASILLPASAALSGFQAIAQEGPGQPGISAGPGAPPAPQAAPAATQISAEFRQILEQHGSFAKHERYGEVWQPANVAQDWQPYPACLWTYKQDTGWYLDDPSEWGRIVHHHGRWTQDGEKGWVWVAGAEFSPAWVVWDNSPSKVGWAPKMPDIDEKEIDLEEYKKSGAFQYVEAAKFGQKCGGPAPRISAAPPPPRFAPIRAAEPMPVQGGYTGGGYVGGGIVGGGIVVVGGICKFKPWLPRCRPFTGNFCLRHPFHPRCRVAKLPPSCSSGIRPSWCAPICRTKPWMPMCRGGLGRKPVLVKKVFPHRIKPGHFRPHRPIVKRFGPHVRPHRIVRPHRPVFRPHQIRPNRIVRPNRVFQPRQNFRPARSFGQRPVVRQRMSGNVRGRRF